MSNPTINTEVSDIYKDIILDLYRHPLNKKIVVDFDKKYHEVNASCGDDVEVMIKFDKDNKVEDIGHQGQGCAISQAGVSLITDFIKGKTKKEILAIDEKQGLELLQIPISYARTKCALLGLKAIKNALK